jgi:hypothetical protein
MRRLFSMSVEEVNWLFQLISVGLVALTFVAAAVVAITGNRIQKRQSLEIADAGQKAAAANERAAKLEIEAAAQRERAAKAEQSLLELQQRLAPRTVTPEQAKTISAALEKFRVEKLSLYFAGASQEVERFADALAAAFRNAGIVVDVTAGLQFGGMKSGLLVTFGSKRESMADAVGRALHAAKVIDGPLPAQRSKAEDELTLSVWPK